MLFNKKRKKNLVDCCIQTLDAGCIVKTMKRLIRAMNLMAKRGLQKEEINEIKMLSYVLREQPQNVVIRITRVCTSFCIIPYYISILYLTAHKIFPEITTL